MFMLIGEACVSLFPKKNAIAGLERALWVLTMEKDR